MQQSTGQQGTDQQQQAIIRVALEAVLPDGSSSRFDVQQVLQHVMKQRMPLVTLQFAIWWMFVLLLLEVHMFAIAVLFASFCYASSVAGGQAETLDKVFCSNAGPERWKRCGVCSCLLVIAHGSLSGTSLLQHEV